MNKELDMDLKRVQQCVRFFHLLQFMTVRLTKGKKGLDERTEMNQRMERFTRHDKKNWGKEWEGLD